MIRPSASRAPADEAAAYLGQRALVRPLARARAQVERLGRVGGSVLLDELTPEEAHALSGLLATLSRRARPRAGHPFRLRLGDLDLALRATRFQLQLADALELIGPPLESRPRRRALAQAASAQRWSVLLAHPLCRREPAARAWVQSLRDRGSLDRATGGGGAALLGEALDLGVRLPSSPPIERTRLATELAGDPHALDDERALARLMLSQLAFRTGSPRPALAPERRALWERFGVIGHRAAADVLTLGLRPLPGGPLARSLLLLSGGHVRVTVGQLAVEPLRFPPGLDVFLCENETVLTAAESRLGPDAPPLLCTGGWPNSAVSMLLHALSAVEARLRFHGDFDWDGVRIAVSMRERFGAAPWSFDAPSYRAGVRRHRAHTRPLEGLPAVAQSHPELVEAMKDVGLELHEEAVLDELLDDLGSAARPEAAARRHRGG
jgi:uncharacterized protein (TIGR02679 family)